MKGWGKIATLIAPANHAWEESTQAAPALPVSEQEKVSDTSISEVAGALSNGKATALFLGGHALREECLYAAGRIARASDARILCETFPARVQRGAGRVPVERLPYFAEQAMEHLSGFEQLILVGASAPVSFFAYPGKKSWLTPENCEVLTLAQVDQDMLSALEGVAAAVGATEQTVTAPPVPEQASRPAHVSRHGKCSAS
jgi:acetolactate synthase-1/2/3 large subunit